MKFKIEPDKPITLFVRFKGTKGVREMRAVLDTGSQYCIIPLQDARQLGYDAYFNADDPGEGTKGITKTDLVEVDEIELEEVSVGDLVAKRVKSLVWTLPRLGGLEATLGLSFLEQFKTTLDFKQGYLIIESAP
ncbi:MAG: aspartyl protease family protein [Dehalococcoidales bacterium]|nr:aspartyl protease family protein [Dehalococcoidales bacterium]